MTKLNFLPLSFGILDSLFDLPAVPVNRFRVELPALNCHGFPFVTKHFAGQAGILRFAFDLALDLRHSCRPSS